MMRCVRDPSPLCRLSPLPEPAPPARRSGLRLRAAVHRATSASAAALSAVALSAVALSATVLLPAVLLPAALLAGCAVGPPAGGDVAIWADPSAARAGAAAGDGASPFGVSRVDPASARDSAQAPGGNRPASGSESDTAGPASGSRAPPPLVDASGGALREQVVDLAAASLRLVDRLIEAGSQRVDAQTLPKSLLIWPVRELGTGRHTVATRTVTRLAAARARAEFRGLAPATLDGWARGQGDWAIVAGLRWVSLAPEGPPVARSLRTGTVQTRPSDAQLCGVLIDRRSQQLLAHFVQRIDPASLDLTPAAFHADLPVVPQTSGSVLDAGLCGGARLHGEQATGTGAARSGRDAAGWPEVAALVQALDLELGLQHYEVGDHRRAAAAFGRAADVMGNADIEALAGLAMSLERSQPARAAQAWTRLADAALGRGRVTLNGSVQGFLPPATAADADPADRAGWADPAERVDRTDEAQTRVRRRAAQRARLGPEGEGPRARLLRRASVAVASRLQAGGQCALIIAHQDDREAAIALRAPAYERAYVMARWLTLAGGLDGMALEIGNVPIEPAMMGTGSGDDADAWDRRIDVVPVNCLSPR